MTMTRTGFTLEEFKAFGLVGETFHDSRKLSEVKATFQGQLRLRFAAHKHASKKSLEDYARQLPISKRTLWAVALGRTRCLYEVGAAIDNHCNHIGPYRRSGRTTRMMVAALAAADAGSNVVIVAHNLDHAEQLKFQYLTPHGDKYAKNIVIVKAARDGTPTLLPKHVIFKGRTETFYDHFVFESHHADWNPHNMTGLTTRYEKEIVEAAAQTRSHGPPRGRRNRARAGKKTSGLAEEPATYALQESSGAA